MKKKHPAKKQVPVNARKNKHLQKNHTCKTVELSQISGTKLAMWFDQAAFLKSFWSSKNYRDLVAKIANLDARGHFDFIRISRGTQKNTQVDDYLKNGVDGSLQDGNPAKL